MSAPFMDCVPASRRRYRGFVWLAIACALVALAWTARIPLLRSAAGMWIVSDAVAPADAAAYWVAVSRAPFAAADYYRDGLVNKVLVADVRLSPSETTRRSRRTPNRIARCSRARRADGPIEHFGTSVRTRTTKSRVTRMGAAEPTQRPSLCLPNRSRLAACAGW